MTEVNSSQRYDLAEEEDTGWLGWIVFAATMLAILGVFHAMAGLVALFRDGYYVVPSANLLITLDYSQWGWIHLIMGIVTVVAGIALFRGATWARVVAVVVASVSAITNLAFLAANPIWSAIMIAVNILVIYAVTVHGREARYS
jgi:hypothetical protein